MIDRPIDGDDHFMWLVGAGVMVIVMAEWRRFRLLYSVM